MKKYIKPEMETLVLSEEALMDVNFGLNATSTGKVRSAKDNNIDVWEDEIEE